MYVCALSPMGEPPRPEQLADRLVTARGSAAAPLDVIVAGSFAAVALTPGQGGRPLVAHVGSMAAVGDVRIDDRAALERAADRVGRADTDLELVLHLYAARGESGIGSLVGDFGVVIWDARAHKLVAARDAFGVKPLFYRATGGALTLASVVEPLRDGEQYDHAFMADFLTGQAAASDRTIWADVRSVPAGQFMVQRGTVRRVFEYWSAARFEPRSGPTTAADIGTFRDLLATAVTRQIGDPRTTWAHLSGGLDSSAVVALAHVQGGGLGGTLTVVDSLGAGDERAYSDTVVQRYAVRNEQIHDYWAWQDDGSAPPALDQPWPLYPFYARDRRMRTIAQAAGARVVLTGVGADHYLSGSLDYITDLAAAGRMQTAARELARWAAATRQSYWRLAREHVAAPLLNALTGAAPRADVPAWLEPAFVARADVTERLALRAPVKPRGRAFAGAICRELGTLPAWIERYGYGDGVELRYPFLYRPLVEFALGLPRDARIRPVRRKWILREATRGLLPEVVRTRGGKGGIDARVLWSLQRERQRIDELLHAPILAELGVISGAALRAAVQQARHGICENRVFLMSALGLETWLAVRAGRWSPGQHAARHAA